MKPLWRTLAAAAICAAAGLAQTPVITAVQDAGEYSGDVARGSIFVVKGTSIVDARGVVLAPGFPLATSLANVKITFTPVEGQGEADAYMVYTYNVDRQQLSAILPSNTVAGDYYVTVTNNGRASAKFPVRVVGRKFRMLTQDTTGSGRALVQNHFPDRYDVNRFTTGVFAGATFSPSYPRQAIVVWGTGLGPLTGVADNVAPGEQDFARSANIAVLVGGMRITPTYAGRAPGLPGTDEIILTLPANVPTGCMVSLQVSVDGQMSNPTTIAIAPEGADACVSSFYSKAMLTRLDQGGALNIGVFTLTSFVTDGGTVETSTGSFARYGGAQLASAAAFTNPPGTCQVFRRVGTETALRLGSAGTRLDAGARLTLSGLGVDPPADTLQRAADRFYSLRLEPTPDLSIIGTYQLRGTGGADVGAFDASLTAGSGIRVSALPPAIDRGAGVTVTWSGGGPNDLVHIEGYSGVKVAATATEVIYDAGVFLCTAPGNAREFTIPASVLNQLPPTPGGEEGVGIISVAASSVPAPANGLFTAPLTAGGSIDVGLFLATVGSLAHTAYR